MPLTVRETVCVTLRVGEIPYVHVTLDSHLKNRTFGKSTAMFTSRPAVDFRQRHKSEPSRHRQRIQNATQLESNSTLESHAPKWE